MSYGSADTNPPIYEYRDGSPSGSPPPSDAPVPPPVPVFKSHLLDRLLEATGKAETVSSGRLVRFLQEPSLSQSLFYWLGDYSGSLTREQVVRRLNRDVSVIDGLLNDQVNAILHHPQFQKLEASWRGLRFLVDQQSKENDPAIKIKVMNATWRDLERDFEKAGEADFDRSHLFRRVYEDEFGTPGGEPFGVLLGDYEVHPRPSSDHPHDDIAVLSALSRVAAASFCPFITSASPSLFGLDDFGGLEHSLNHAKTFEQKEFIKWRALREIEDSRFLGLALPRVLMRLPHRDDGARVDRFCFQEQVAGPDRSRYLWGNACYAFGAVLIRAFAESGWLADIRGVQRDTESRGLVTGLPVHCFSTDKRGVAPKSSTDVIVSDELEKELSDLGFLPLCDCQDTAYSAFYSSQSVQKPKTYDRAPATANARISAMLQYIFCVSRFAHYIKVLGRDKVGSFGEPEELERFLAGWVARYVNADSDAAPAVKCRYPLREAQIRVHPQPGKPGSYQCVMHLNPHYELDEINASVRLKTELAPPRGS